LCLLSRVFFNKDFPFMWYKEGPLDFTVHLEKDMSVWPLETDYILFRCICLTLTFQGRSRSKSQTLLLLATVSPLWIQV
jgi:hypothetical protein